MSYGKSYRRSNTGYKTKYNEFQKACKTILPKIDRKLIEDFLYRQQDDPNTKSKYSIEVTIKERLDTEKIKDLVWNKIGEIPDIDNPWYVL